MDGISTTVRVLAKRENLTYVMEEVHKFADNLGANHTVKRHLAVACDEIFSNIVKYAYLEKTGYVQIEITSEAEELILCFSDTGMPFNPLEAPEIDRSLPPEQRPVGKMGIQIVRELAKSVSYTYENGENRLTVVFMDTK